MTSLSFLASDPLHRLFPHADSILTWLMLWIPLQSQPSHMTLSSSSQDSIAIIKHTPHSAWAQIPLSGYHVHLFFTSRTYLPYLFGFHLIDTRANCSEMERNGEKEEEKEGKQTQPFTWIWSPDPPMSCWALTQTYGHGLCETPPHYLQLEKYNLKHALLKELLYFIYHLLCVLNRSKAFLDQNDLLHWIEDDNMWAEIKRMGEELSRWSREGRLTGKSESRKK